MNEAQQDHQILVITTYIQVSQLMECCRVLERTYTHVCVCVFSNTISNDGFFVLLSFSDRMFKFGSGKLGNWH